MVANICRLCYEKKARPIAIFSGKGAKLKIAETIRQHFPDTVLENDDLLPKFVCSSCWSKLEDFHEFYCAVDVAKNAYLEVKGEVKVEVKEEEPNFIEIFCVGHVEDETLVEDEASVEDESMGIDATNLEETSPNHQSQSQSKFADLIETAVSDDSDRDNESAELNERTKSKSNSISEDKSAENVNGSDKETNETPADDSNQLDFSHLRVKCVLCNQLVCTPEEVAQHYRIKHNESAHHKQVTTCCDRKLIPSDIRGHYRYHLDPDVFRCVECSKSFKLLKSLKLHQQTHLPKKYECEFCEAKFPKRVEVKRHKVIAHGVLTQSRASRETAPDRYPLKHCDICKKTFPKMWLLKNHIMRKHATKRFECEICKKCFGTERILLFHVRQVHERRFDRVCHICAKVYSSIAELKKHLPVHSTIKPPRLHCQICGNSYKNERILRQHMDVHKDGQIFSCTQCPKTYSNRSILATHIRNVHNFKWRKCNFCEKECKTNRELKEHVSTHTGEYLYGCIYCSQKFKARPSLYQHKRQHHPIEWEEERPNPRPKKTIPA